VLDSWAMMAFLDGEPAAQEIRQVFRKARKRKATVLFSLINYGECLYVIEREQGVQQAQRAVGIIDQLPLTVVPPDRAQVFEAAHMKARYPISYADSFCIALTKRDQGTTMTGDPEFQSVQGEIQIHWLSDHRRRR
jgi:predicted nucleic acid-binding protein